MADLSSTPELGHPPADEPAEPEEQSLEAPVEDELLVEEVSIDGMCGVY